MLYYSFVPSISFFPNVTFAFRSKRYLPPHWFAIIFKLEKLTWITILYRNIRITGLELVILSGNREKRKMKNKSNCLFHDASVIWNGRETHSGSALTQVRHTYTYTHVHLPFVLYRVCVCVCVFTQRTCVYIHRESHTLQFHANTSRVLCYTNIN